MWHPKRKGILGIHAATKVIEAQSTAEERIQRYGVATLGLSGTGKATDGGHTH